MAAHFRAWSLAVVFAVIVAGIAGFWLGRTTGRPTPPQPVVETTPAGPSDLVASLREGRDQQDQRAGELLAWCERLYQNARPGVRVSLEDNAVAYHAMTLFGELKYTPAIDFLVRETVEPKIMAFDPTHREGLAFFDQRHPQLQALIRIGAPAAAQLVDGYVRVWKAEKGKGNPHSVLPSVTYALSDDSLIGAALVYIRKRLGTIRRVAELGAVDLDELEALSLLRQELMKRVDWTD
jgi:hypothetical protein